MAVAYVDHTISKSTAARSNYSFEHVVPAGNDRLLLVFIGHGKYEVISSVTYDGNALTFLVEIDAAAEAPSTAIYYRVLGSSGSPTTADVYVGSSTGNWNPDYCAAANLTGVDQSDPIGADQTTTIYSNTITVSITTDTADSLLFGGGAITGADGTPFTQDDSQTERWDEETGGGSNTTDYGFWGSHLAAATAQAYDFGVTASVTDRQTMAVAEIHAAVSAVETQDSRNARTHGKATSQDDRSARTHGKAEAQDDRSARTHGKATSQDDRAARTHGGVISQDDRAARTHGGIVSQDDRSARTHGKATAQDDRDARTHGKATAQDDRDARTHGGIVEQDSRDARTHGTADSQDSRHARTHGKAEAQDSRDARTHGGIVSQTSRNARTEGRAPAVGIGRAELEGALRDYTLYIYGGISPYMAIRNTFPQVNVINILGASFTNNRLGGCGNATFVLSSKNHEYLASQPIRPDHRVAFHVQCEGESEMKLRYSGRITQAEMGYGTEKGTRTIKCEGRMTLTRGIPVIVIASNISVQAAAIKLVSFLANRTLGIQYGETDLITAGSAVMIPMLDGLDTPGDRLLKMLARLAGPDVAYGYTVGRGTGFYAIGQAMNRMYLAEMDETVVDPGFTVGVNLTQAEGKEFREGLYNGALVRCQQSLGGGQLTMFYPPPSSGDGMKPWRIANLNVPEVVEPGIGWDYATAWVDAHSFRDGEYNQSVKFHAADFGRQIWPNEVIKNKLRVYMREPETVGGEGRVPVDAVVNSYTVKIGGDGSVSTDFQLGTPPINLGQEWKKVYQEVQLAEIREFWSTAEMAAGDSDVMRTWRRAAARQWWIRNFWGANLDSLESVLSKEDYLDSVTMPVGGVNYYEWEYDPQLQAVVSGLESGLDSALVASIRIPTGRLATGCAVYAKGAQRTFTPASYAAWNTTGSGSFVWKWLTSIVYPQPTGISGPADYQARLSLQQTFGADMEAQPVTLEIERPRMNAGGAQTFDLTSFLASAQWTDFGSGFDAASTRYYGVRLIRGHHTGGWGVVYVLPGWYEEGAFHTDHFITPPALGSFTVGDDDSPSDVSDYSHLRIELELPNPDNDFGAFYVTISKRDTGEVLYTGGGAVEPFLPDGLWDPIGTQWAVAQWKDYPTHFLVGGWVPDRRPHGLRKVIVPEAGGFTVLATRNDSIWTQGLSGELLTLWGDGTNESGDYGIRIGVHINRMQALKAWGLAFHLEDDQWPDP